MTNEELMQIRQERGKQVLNIGDKVIAHSASDKPLYDGKVATIIEKGILGNEVYYGLYIEGVTVEKRSTPIIGKREIIGNTSLLAPFYAEDLELVKEPKPKFKVGDKVVAIKSDENIRKGWVGYVTQGDGFDYVEVRFANKGADLCYVRPDMLTPYTEPTAEEGEETALTPDEKWLKWFNEETTRENEEMRVVEEYRKELAAKIAVAYAEKGRYEPYEIGAKAVEVANGVVERLKNTDI